MFLQVTLIPLPVLLNKVALSISPNTDSDSPTKYANGAMD